MTAAAIKTTGYLISSVSVVLLGIVSLKTAAKDPLLAVALAGGMATSLLGMAMRWWSYRLEKD